MSKLAQLTGLKPDAAADCLAQFNGSVLVALASVVQSNAKKNIPDAMFDDKEAIANNAKHINDLLLSLYSDAIRIKLSKNLTDQQAFDALVNEKTKSVSAKRYEGCFLDMPYFWEKEVVERATIFNLNRGFIEQFKDNYDALRTRQLKWYNNCPLYQTPLRRTEIENEDEETVRVIIKDATRTFFEEVHRRKFVEFLYSVSQEFKSYGQAMSYFAAICLLTLTEQETVAILRKCHKEYISGHWAHEAVGFNINAWVVEKIMHQYVPDVAKHFKDIGFWPDTYMQKILSGLSIHVLPFELMFEFLDEFMAHGFSFLVKFELAICEHFRTELLALPKEKINELYEIMRLDPKIYDVTHTRAILDRAKKMKMTVSADDINILRSQTYDKIIAPRMKKCAEFAAKDFSEKCEHCKMNSLDNAESIWCNTCEMKICGQCYKGGKCNNSSCVIEKLY